jgi:hypothetical protein
MKIRPSLTPNHRPGAIWLLGLLIADAVLLGGTNAGKVSAGLLMLGFGLVIGSVYWLIYACLAVLRLYGLVIRQKRRLAATLAGLAACVLALQSVGELNAKDVLLLLPLITIGYSYISYSLDQRSAG